MLVVFGILVVKVWDVGRHVISHVVYSKGVVYSS